MKRNVTATVLLSFFCLIAAYSFAQTPTNPYKAPLYWNPYEYNIETDGYIPENEWSANIDWMEQNLKSYGYNMVCIDGWGDDGKYNQDGYRTTHSSTWQHDYAWWSANLQSRGMTLGIYNNPLWIIKSAADAGVKVKGTNIPLSSLVSQEEVSNNYLFKWVQIERPGAEEYVKGYIQYYADMGVKFLRVDFLSWFEDGNDKGNVVGINRPHEDYATALKWMREACDANGIFLSLVMPHLKNEAEVELQYGHMMRINEDAGLEASWSRFNNLDRGIRHPYWSQWYNAFDGYTYWSYLSGRNKIILDGDFIRLNTFANDDEKKSVISMHLMAGGPVSVADQYSSIGNNIWLYQNNEMLALNQDRFVGKPLTNDPTIDSSQIWKGQMSNGDWIVGLFNREDTAKTRSISFSGFGFTKNKAGNIRDLWQHNDLGAKTSYSVKIPPHGCVILKVTKAGPTQATAPVLNKVQGIYTTNVTVKMTSASSGANIYYTLDGTVPSASSALYTAPLTVSVTTTIKAVAVKTGLNNSPVTSGYYVINKAGVLPSPWKSAAVGKQQPAGSSSYTSTAGAFVNTASGKDIEDTADAFRFIYQPVKGDAVITARIDSLTSISDWTKAGVMIRESLAANTKNAMIGITLGHGVTFQNRSVTAGGTSGTIVAGVAAPLWLRIQRSGNDLTGFYSTDSINWKQAGSTVTLSMATQVYAGLAYTSHSNGTLGYATFSKVQMGNTSKIASKPVFSVAGGTYTEAQSVALTSSTPGAAIHYTTDGTVPNASSPVYSSPVTVSSTTTINAYASAAGLMNSVLVSATYIFNTPHFSSSMYAGGSFNGWSLGNTPMTLVNSVWTATGVQIGAGDQQMKFANSSNWSNQDWGNATGLSGTASLTTGGGPNISFTAPSSGSYSITFNEITVAYSIVKENVYSSNMYIGGTFDNWTLGNAPMTLTDGVWKATGIQISKGDQIMKFANSSDWSGQDWGNATGLSGTASLTTGGGPFITFTAPANGSYTFMFNELSGAYSIVSENAIADGIFTIKAKHSGKVLDVQGGSMDNGALIHQWEAYNNFPSQQWQLTATTDGYYIIKNINSGKVLDVVGGSPDDGAGIHQWESYNNFPSQQWKITATGDGYYKIENRNSGKALDVYGASADNGALVNQYTYTGGNNQQWNFEMITAQAVTNQFTTKTTGSTPKQEATTATDIRVYPNPASSLVTITRLAGEGTIMLFNNLGTNVYQSSVSKGVHVVNVSSFPAGLYYIKIQTGNTSSITQKLVISH